MNFMDWRVMALAGSTLWGSWALYVNWPAGLRSAALSAVTQALVSACSISFLSLLANYVLSRRWPSVALQVVAGTLLPYGVLLTVVVGCHWLVGTRNIVMTVLPSSSIGLAYSALYAWKNRSAGRPTSHADASAAQLN